MVPDILDSTLRSATTWLETGGPVIVILALMSVAALAIVFVKIAQLAGVRRVTQAELGSMVTSLRNGDVPRARHLLASRSGPVFAVLLEALDDLSAGTDPEIAREEAARRATVVLDELGTYVRALEVIAALSPLLGLLGTVLGMIEAFQAMEQAGHRVDPAVLSSGVWQALLTTATGLAIAIPVVVVLNGIERHIERVRQCLEDGLTRIFTSTRLPPAQEARVAPMLADVDLEDVPARNGEA